MNDDFQFAGYDEATRNAITEYRALRNKDLVMPIVRGIAFYFRPDGVDADAPLRDLVAAIAKVSLTMMEFILSVEEALDIRLADEELRQLSDFAAFESLIAQKVSVPPGS